MLPIILACTRGNFGKQIQILMGTFPKQRNREYSAHDRNSSTSGGVENVRLFC